MNVTVEAVRYVLVINRTQQDHYTPARQRAEIVVKKAAKGDKGDPGAKGEPGSSSNDDPGDLTLWFDNALIG